MSVVEFSALGTAAVDSQAFLYELLKGVYPRGFAVRLWEGTTLPSSQGAPARFTLVIKHPGALQRMFSAASELSLGEAYIWDDYDIEGDIEAAVCLGNHLIEQELTLSERLRLQSLLSRVPDTGPLREHRAPQPRGRLHSKERDRRAVRYHYDVSNDFYALFLDSRMTYSAAYFVDADDDLDKAQVQKLERICRTLRLKEGERFLDIGCGWGGLMIYAAQNFGVDATGITLSVEQAELARRRIQESGLEARCRVELCDYRNLPVTSGFDKIASVGMVEHVGANHLREYFRRTFRLLRPRGIFLNSGISRLSSDPARRTGSFVDAYVFPDSELEPIHEVLQSAEMAGFEVCSTENLREHYGRTLRSWVQRLESHADDARRLTDERTYRTWRLYMAGSAARFMSGKLHVFQTVLAKPGG